MILIMKVHILFEHMPHTSRVVGVFTSNAAAVKYAKYAHIQGWDIKQFELM